MNRIRVVYIIDIFDTDLAGTENQLLKMIRGLDATRFDVQLICLTSHPWFEQHGATLGCPAVAFQIRDFKKPRTYWHLVKLIGHLRRLKPDVVQTFFPISNIVGVLAATLAGVPSILSSRRDYGEWMTARYLAATKLANRFADKIVANSAAVRALTEQKEHLRNGKLQVIYNGMEVEHFAGLTPDPTLRRRLAIPEGDKVIGLVANFRPMKRHDTCVRALAEIARRRRDVTALFLGYGPMRPALEQLARDLGIADKICFAGSQPDIRSYLALMDVGVNCSEMEGLSNAVMEYMAAGVPCVVSDSGGNRDLITHNVHGLTFPLGDHQTLAEHLLSLLGDAVLRRRLADGARKKILTEMTLPAMLAQYETLYADLVDRTIRAS